MYILASILALTNFGFRGYVKLFWVLLFFISAFAIRSLGHNLSLGAFLLEFALFIPFILFLLGASVKGRVSSINIMRALNFLVFFESIINMVLNYGFPTNLPYVNFLPDAYGAFYGLGGAKIVTVIGFFGLMAEYLYRNGRAIAWSWFFLVVASSNFIIPNYVIGILCGVSAVLIVSRKGFYTWLIFAVVLMVFGGYITYRFETLNNYMSDELGMHPKIYAYYIVFLMFVENPLSILIGTGLGQFSGVSALWASEYLAEISTHGIPNLPLFFMSDYHDEYLGGVLSYVGDSIWYLSSSANKPYSSFSTLLAETGLVVTCFLVYFLRLRFKSMAIFNVEAKAVFWFCIGLMFLDNWHDSPWLGFCLITFSGFEERSDAS
tara:strand:- start:13684 stop:14817 length:1134 start_codon:yes stop_codon:yes gene_type:complete